MNVAVRSAEIDVLREENRQLRDLLAPALRTPREWALTGSEETLFAHLCSRSIITLESAHAALYGLGDERNPKIVDVFICKLRKKLKPLDIEIETVWGRGFSLKDRLRWRVALEQETDGKESGMNLEQISFAVPAVVFTNLAKRAAPLNIRPVEYARRLFEAAYAARIAGERGQETEDAALDHQVRQVFLLADCEPEFIADALRMPVDRVKRMLTCWRLAARELAEPKPKLIKLDETGAPVPSAAVAPTKTGAMDAGEVAVIRNLWREGKTVAAIAETLGRPHKAVANFSARNRHICPSRRGIDA